MTSSAGDRRRSQLADLRPARHRTPTVAVVHQSERFEPLRGGDRPAALRRVWSTSASAPAGRSARRRRRRTRPRPRRLPRHLPHARRSHPPAACDDEGRRPALRLRTDGERARLRRPRARSRRGCRRRRRAAAQRRRAGVQPRRRGRRRRAGRRPGGARRRPRLVHAHGSCICNDCSVCPSRSTPTYRWCSVPTASGWRSATAPTPSPRSATTPRRILTWLATSLGMRRVGHARGPRRPPSGCDMLRRSAR